VEVAAALAGAGAGGSPIRSSLSPARGLAVAAQQQQQHGQRARASSRQLFAQSPAAADAGIPGEEVLQQQEKEEDPLAQALRKSLQVRGQSAGPGLQTEYACSKR
jgi:hypothetical protein